MALALCHHSDTSNFEVAARFVQVWSPLLCIPDVWEMYTAMIYKFVGTAVVIAEDKVAQSV
jgi:hypothetical protein